MPGMYLKFMYFFLVFTQNLKPYTFFLPWSLFLYRKPSIFIASCLVHGHLKAPLIHLEAEVLRWRNPPIFPTFRKSLYFWCNWGSMNLENSSGVRHIYIYIRTYTLEVVATVKKRVKLLSGDDFQPYSKYGESHGSQPIEHGGWLDFQGIYLSFLTLEILQKL